jgi:uncharacterized membrane protein
MPERELDRLTERFDRLEREVEELKRTSSVSTRMPPPPDEARSPVSQVRGTAHSAAKGFGSAETFVLGARVPETTDIEESVVGTWFPRLGALALLLGVGFGFKYAVDRGWLGAGARVGLGVALGLAMLLIGETTKRRGWAGYAQAVTGGGVAVLYLTIWASFELYHMLPGLVAFGLLTGISATAAVLALRHDSMALAVLATLGGFLNPIVVGRGTLDVAEGYAYTVALDIGVLALASVRRWRLLDKVAFVGSWTLYGLSQASGSRGMIFATTIFLLFGSVPYLHSVARRRLAVPQDVVQMATNGAVYYAVSFGNLASGRGALTLALCGIYLLQGLAVLVVARNDGLLRLGTFGPAMTLFTLWIFLEADPTWLPALWAGEGLALTLIGYGVRSSATRLGGAAVLALSAAATLYSFEDFRPQHLLFSEGALVYVCEIMALYAVAYLTSRLPGERSYAAIAGVAANLITLAWLSLEARAAIDMAVPAIRFARVFAFSLSAIWAVYAGLLLVVGIAFRLRSARLLAVIVFAVTLIKMAVSDLLLVGQVHRIISFVGIGALLLACSLLFHRFKHLVMEDRVSGPNN